jgi:hypothetical protein
MGGNFCGWNGCPWDTGSKWNGFIQPLRSGFTNLGVPSPVNIRYGDEIRLCGSAYLTTDTETPSGGGYFLIGLYSYKCSDYVEKGIGKGGIILNTVVNPTPFQWNPNLLTCFDITHVLTEYLDACDVHYVVGMDFVGINGQWSGKTLGKFSYTLNYTRDCTIPNGEFYLLRNCCEPAYTEIVLGVSLTIGSFWSDAEGNCWEIESLTVSSPNSYRTLVNNYTDCADCIDSNTCPDNFILSNCCLDGEEYVAGAVGLVLGDTFVDDNGFCWDVVTGTSLPITAPSIMIGTSGYTSCSGCTGVNECPLVYYVEPCCTTLSPEYIPIPASTGVNAGEYWVDSDGLCWKIGTTSTSLPTNYSITLVSEILGTSLVCDDIVDDCYCPETIFVTLRECCDPSHVIIAEMLYVPPTKTTFSDDNGVCWEVLGWDVTGPENWGVVVRAVNLYDSCGECLADGNVCELDYYLFETCCDTGFEATGVTYGNYDIGKTYVDGQGNCFSPVSATTLTPTLYIPNTPIFDSCQSCLSANTCQWVEIQDCCLVLPNEVVLLTSNDLNGTFYDSASDNCWEFFSASTGPATAVLGTITPYLDCGPCTTAHAC